MDRYHRSILRAEEKFFDECDTGNGRSHYTMVRLSLTAQSVPVVVLFTKCEALLAIAFGKLKPEEKKLPREQQLLRMKENNPAWRILLKKRYPPRSCVHLESKYGDLVKCSLVNFICYRHA